MMCLTVTMWCASQSQEHKLKTHQSQSLNPSTNFQASNNHACYWWSTSVLNRKVCISRADAFLRKLLRTFFGRRGWNIQMFEKKCKHRAVSMDKSCPVVVLDGWKHRAVSMDKSCLVVLSGNSKRLECFLLYMCGARGCTSVCQMR